MITNDASCTQDTKSCTVVVKAAMNKKQKALFTSKLNTKLRNKLVKGYIWRRGILWCWNCGKLNKNTREVLKLGAGEGWRDSVGLIM